MKKWKFIKLEVKGEITAISSSTSLNSYGERYTVEHLKIMIEQTNKKSRLMGLEHLYNNMPLGLTYKAELVELENGEYGCKIFTKCFVDPKELDGFGLSAEGSPAKVSNKI